MELFLETKTSWHFVFNVVAFDNRMILQIQLNMCIFVFHTPFYAASLCSLNPTACISFHPIVMGSFRIPFLTIFPITTLVSPKVTKSFNMVIVHVENCV